MTLRLRLILLVPLVPLLIFAQGQSARPNFSGGWVMGDPADDSMKTGTDSPFMRVGHQEPRLKVTISVSSKSSQKDVWSLTTDGVENLDRMNGKEVRSRTHWQGDSPGDRMGNPSRWQTHATSSGLVGFKRRQAPHHEHAGWRQRDDRQSYSPVIRLLEAVFRQYLVHFV